MLISLTVIISQYIDICISKYQVVYFKYIKFYLFIYFLLIYLLFFGCVGSSLLRVGFL